MRDGKAALWLVLVAAAFLLQQVSGRCVRPRQDLAYCDMVDYKVYDSLDIPDVQKQANEMGEMQINAWREFVKQAQGSQKKKKKAGATAKGVLLKPSFCEELIRATTCNLFMPPCDGDGTQRYRKPCKAYTLALQHGCNWTMNVGDLSFAEPPDCFELPIRSYTETEYLDAIEIGASGEADKSSRADDILAIASLLDDQGHLEHAAFMYLQALRYRPDDNTAHMRAFALVHALQEHVKSLVSQLALAQEFLPSTSRCRAMEEELDLADIARHKGLGPGAKIQYILEYARSKQSRVFYETGVWYGETINGLKGHFERLISIEISDQIAELARKRFSKNTNVEILTGDSVELLPKVLKERDRAAPAIFWLDGHFSGSRFETAKADMDTPILAELDMTLEQVGDDDVVLIDDARLFQGYHKCVGDLGTECYPTVDDLRTVLCRRQPEWTFTIEDDLIRMEKEDSAPGSARRGQSRPGSPEGASRSGGTVASEAGGASGGGAGAVKGGGRFGPSKGEGKQGGSQRQKISAFEAHDGGGGEDGGKARGGGGGASQGGHKIGKSQAGRKVPVFGSANGASVTSAEGSTQPRAQADAKGAFHIRI